MKLVNAIKRIFGKDHIYVFGDSHTAVFNYINSKILHSKKFVVNRVDGATAMGMVNPNSSTNALPKFTADIDRISPKSKLIFLLGEVDCGFLIWYRKQTLNLDVNEQMEKSIQNYSVFLKKLLEDGYKNIYVVSSPLPSIKDEFMEEQGNELRRQIKIPHKERIQLSLKYNQILKAACLDNNINYIDLDGELYDSREKELRKEYFSRNLKDHHLDQNSYAKLIAAHLKKYNLL